MKKVYLIGQCGGSFRTQNLVKILLDDKVEIFYENMISLRNFFRKKFPRIKILASIFGVLDEILRFPQKLIALVLCDVVYVTAMNHIYLWSYEAALARLLGKEVICDFYISFYDTLVFDHKTHSPRSLWARVVFFRESTAIKLATKVCFISNTETDRYLSLLGCGACRAKAVRLPLCVDNRLPGCLPFYRKGKSEFTIAWWGTFIPLHGLDYILKMISLYGDRAPKIRLYIFGDHEFKAAPYKVLASELGVLEKVVFDVSRTFSNGRLEPFLVENVDLVLGGFGTSEKAKNVLVNKAIDGIALRIPVLTGESTAVREFFDGENDIWICERNPEAMACELERIVSLPAHEIERRTEVSYQKFKNTFSYEAYRSSLLALVQESDAS